MKETIQGGIFKGFTCCRLVTFTDRKKDDYVIKAHVTKSNDIQFSVQKKFYAVAINNIILTVLGC